MIFKRRAIPAFVIALAILAGCVPEGQPVTTVTPPSPEVSVTPAASNPVLPDELVAVVDGEDIYMNELRFQLLSVFESYMNYMGEYIDWDSATNGQSSNTFFLEQALDNVLHYRSVYVGAKKTGVTFDDADRAEIETQLQTEIEQFGGEEEFNALLAEEGVTSDFYKYVNIATPKLYNKMYETLYAADGAFAVSDDELIEKYSATNHIMVMLYDEATGEPLSAAEIEERRLVMARAYSELVDGSDFQTVRARYSEEAEEGDEAFLFTPDMLVQEYINIVDTLEIGDYSYVHELYNTLVIIQRVDPKEHVSEGELESMREEYSLADFNAKLYDWQLEIEYSTTEAFEKIDARAIYGEYYGI